MARIATVCREHWMLIAAAAAALASMVFVPPDAAYLGYLDWKTLGSLFCVLACANAFRLIGAFDRIARSTMALFTSPQKLALVIVGVTAGFSMLFTNDIALVVMLPISAAALVGMGSVHLIPAVFAMQALAANLCGMVMPFGNPQNLYIYSHYHLGIGEFLGTMALPFLASAAAIAAVTWVIVGRVSARQGEGARCGNRAADGGALPASASRAMPLDRRRLRAYTALFAFVLLAIFGIVPIAVAVVVVAAAIAISDRRALAEVDYALLATFACFFIFAGNMARMPIWDALLAPAMEQWGLLVAAGLSQLISNVPAAVLLSHFTDAWQPLLIGVNIGGAGTFIGSLASLIAIRYFSLSRRVFPQMRAPSAPSTKDFLLLFAALNAAFFIALIAACCLAGSALP